MSLTDPELDMLRELLLEDPAADVFADVSRELLRRGEANEAVQVLSRALEERRNDLDAWGLLATAAAATRAWARSLEALAVLGDEVASDPDLARVRIIALEAVGRSSDARAAIGEYLARHGTDEDVSEVLARIDAPEPQQALSASDPHVTVATAEAFVEAGRIERAVRAYRRIAHHNRDDRGVAGRLRRLEAMVADDPTVLLHSEELPVPNDLVPPDLEMPAPNLTRPDFVYGGEVIEPGEDEAPTERMRNSKALPGTAEVLRALAGSFEDDDEDDDEPTQLFQAVNVEEAIQELKRKQDEES